MKEIFATKVVFAFIVALAVGTLVGCQRDSYDQFCDLAYGANDLDVGSDPGAALASMRELKAAAPDDIKDDIDVLIAAFESTMDMPRDDPDSILAAADAVDHEKTRAAFKAIEDRVDQICTG
ncbi:MAG: hypothetical protein FWF02_06235 [Micrococcales bacterium]|nr:hypothetical protein [Micrococcales bacterium]MCL2667290.1 hypothetical protein [Micrococcales bacterium]